jgi:small subunit ribosomal protein S2
MGAHFGHKKELSHPKAKKYIYTISEGINIINLEKTLEGLEEASKFLTDISKSGKKIVFVGTKRQAKNIVRKTAKECGMPYVDYRWLGGTLTNYKTIKSRIDSYKKLKKDLDSEESKKYIKKERVKLEKKVQKLDKFFLGLKDIDGMPGALFLVDPGEEHVALKEAKNMKIPVVALANTDVNFDTIDYPIAGNDNAPKTIEYICNYVSSLIKENTKKSTKKEEK